MIYEYSDLASDSDDRDIEDCPECESDRTVMEWEDWNGYMMRCKDCDNEFRINYEI